jgi:hypothetical protein
MGRSELLMAGAKQRLGLLEEGDGCPENRLENSSGVSNQQHSTSEQGYRSAVCACGAIVFPARREQPPILCSTCRAERIELIIASRSAPNGDPSRNLTVGHPDSVFNPPRRAISTSDSTTSSRVVWSSFSSAIKKDT